jgi:hypothetical protein
MTSSVRIFLKSLHWMALGWAVAVVWLWYAQIQHDLLFSPVINHHTETLIAGGIPAAVIEACAFLGMAMAGRAPSRALEMREWAYSFVWASFPNLLVLYTVLLIVRGEV